MPRESFHTATPANRTSRAPSRPPPDVRRPPLDTNHVHLGGREDGLDQDLPFGSTVVGLGEAEEGIRQCAIALMELSAEHKTRAAQSARAKSEWLRHLSNVLVRLNRQDERTAAATREAIARSETDPETGKTGTELYLEYKTLDSIFDAEKSALRAIEATLNGWQSINSNVRMLTTRTMGED